MARTKQTQRRVAKKTPKALFSLKGKRPGAAKSQTKKKTVVRRTPEEIVRDKLIAAEIKEWNKLPGSVTKKGNDSIKDLPTNEQKDYSADKNTVADPQTLEEFLADATPLIRNATVIDEVKVIWCNRACVYWKLRMPVYPRVSFIYRKTEGGVDEEYDQEWYPKAYITSILGDNALIAPDDQAVEEEERFEVPLMYLEGWDVFHQVYFTCVWDENADDGTYLLPLPCVYQTPTGLVNFERLFRGVSLPAVTYREYLASEDGNCIAQAVMILVDIEIPPFITTIQRLCGFQHKAGFTVKRVPEVNNRLRSYLIRMIHESKRGKYLAFFNQGGRGHCVAIITALGVLFDGSQSIRLKTEDDIQAVVKQFDTMWSIAKTKS